MADTQSIEKATVQFIEDVERVHKVVNGTSSESVTTEDGSQIPTLRKAMLESLYFKTPPLPWVTGSTSTVFNQLYAYTDSVRGVQWWYAPAATVANAISLPTNPSTSSNWRLYTDSNSIAQLYAPLASPVFTGNPQGPTPASTNNSASFATTAFVVTAISNALSTNGGGNASYNNISATGTIKAADLEVNSTATFLGSVVGDKASAKFKNISLSQQSSTLSFDWEDVDNPDFIKTALTPYQINTHILNADSVLSGTPSDDSSVVSLRGQGNSVLDYLKIIGNTKRPASDPKLEVAGLTKLENVQITGVVTGINFGVDGKDIIPNTLTTQKEASVGGSLSVVENASIQGTMTVGGITQLNGPTTASSLNVAGDTSLTSLSISSGMSLTGGDANISDNLMVAGDASLGGTSGTTRVNNLIVQGSVSGINFDLSQEDLSVKSLVVLGDTQLIGDISVGGDSYLASQDSGSGLWSGLTTVNDLTIHGTVLGLPSPDITGEDINVGTVVAEKISTAVMSESVSGDYTPDGTRNVYYLTATGDFTLNAIPLTEGQAFTGFIYIEQGTVGGRTLTLDSSYVQLNDGVVNQSPGSVTVLQVIYCGVGSIVDVIITPRP